MRRRQFRSRNSDVGTDVGIHAGAHFRSAFRISNSEFRCCPASGTVLLAKTWVIEWRFLAKTAKKERV